MINAEEHRIALRGYLTLIGSLVIEGIILDIILMTVRVAWDAKIAKLGQIVNEWRENNVSR